MTPGRSLRLRQNRVYFAWINRCWRCLLDPFHGSPAVDGVAASEQHAPPADQ